MPDSDVDELNLFEPEYEPEVSATGRPPSRPRRTTRAARKTPRELTKEAAAATKEPRAGSSRAAGSKSSKTSTAAAGANSCATSGTRVASTRLRKQTAKRKAADEDDVDLDNDSESDIVEMSRAPPSRTGGRIKGKAKAGGANGELDLDFLLTSPKSPLVAMEISDILNARVWSSLSDNARHRLEDLLPETAFSSYVPRVEECHPSRDCDRRQQQLLSKSSNSMVCRPESEASDPTGEDMEDVPVKTMSETNRGMRDVSIFSDPHFESAARTFQDHLYTGWYTLAHRELVRKHLENVNSGETHAPWKDEVWVQNHDMPVDELQDDRADSTASPKAKGRGPNAFEPLIKHGLLAVGDILSFSKIFTVHGVAVEKDALVYSIHPKSHAVTLITCGGTRRSLPGQLLVPAADISLSPVDTREITVDSPMQLERSLLDIDGRVPRPDNSHNALKCISMWRWPASKAEEYTEPGMMQCILENQLDRGGRELYGTLFYLRGTTAGT